MLRVTRLHWGLLLASSDAARTSSASQTKDTPHLALPSRSTATTRCVSRFAAAATAHCSMRSRTHAAFDGTKTSTRVLL